MHAKYQVMNKKCASRPDAALATQAPFSGQHRAFLSSPAPLTNPRPPHHTNAAPLRRSLTPDTARRTPLYRWNSRSRSATSSRTYVGRP